MSGALRRKFNGLVDLAYDCVSQGKLSFAYLKFQLIDAAQYPLAIPIDRSPQPIPQGRLCTPGYLLKAALDICRSRLLHRSVRN